MSDDDLVGVIADRQILDLTTFRTPDDLKHITGLKDIVVVAVRESLAAVVERIPQHDVQAVVPIPDDVRVRAQTGSLQVGGDAFSGPDGQNEYLIVVGALIFTSPVTRISLSGMAVVGGIIAPIGSENTLGSALTRITGAITYYRYAEGQHLQMLSGEQSLNSAALANQSGSPDDILIAAGQLIVTEPVATLGYRQLIIAGQIILPSVSQGILGPAMLAAGQTIWYRGTNPRLFMGNEAFGQQFLQLIDDPMTLIIFGSATFDNDVTAEVLRAKVAEIVLFGSMAAPRRILPVLQFLTVEKKGDIRALEDSAGDAG